MTKQPNTTMLVSKTVLLSLLGATSTSAFTSPTTKQHIPTHHPQQRTSPLPMGYLDNLSAELYAEDSSPDPEAESREATKTAKDRIANASADSFEGFVDFNEFDGGDGQMGVAGDGQKGLEKMDAVPQMAKSKMMSAKNAWGTSSGYADQLRSSNPSMDTARAQQLENWANQQEVRAKNLQMKAMTEAFEETQSSAEEDWRQLAKFGVERNEKFDLDEEFGPVVPGETLDGVIELKSVVNRVATFDLNVSDVTCCLMCIV